VNRLSGHEARTLGTAALAALLLIAGPALAGCAPQPFVVPPETAAAAAPSTFPAPPPASAETTAVAPRDAELFRNACHAGDAQGCLRLGLLFAEGRGVGKDEARAAALWTRAADLTTKRCDEGHAVACWELGMAYKAG
jgi:TPR repeat protein